MSTHYPELPASPSKAPVWALSQMWLLTGFLGSPAGLLLTMALHPLEVIRLSKAYTGEDSADYGSWNTPHIWVC